MGFLAFGQQKMDFRPAFSNLANETIACVAGGIRERASGGRAAITSQAASLPKQKHSHAKSRWLRRLTKRWKQLFRLWNHSPSLHRSGAWTWKTSRLVKIFSYFTTVFVMSKRICLCQGISPGLCFLSQCITPG